MKTAKNLDKDFNVKCKRRELKTVLAQADDVKYSDPEFHKDLQEIAARFRTEIKNEK